MNAEEIQALRTGQEAAARNDMSAFFRIHQQLAHTGSAIGQYHLGWCYQQGAGCTADPVLAYQWWRSAALQGEPMAQYAVGASLEHGEGVAVDLLGALAWYFRAEASGSSEAATAFARLSERMRDALPNTSLERTRDG